MSNPFDFDDNERHVCVYCDVEVFDFYCDSCFEYKGVMTVSDWEEYTGETFEE